MTGVQDAPRALRGPIVRAMTGPEPFALVGADDVHTREEWERLAAAVLRKAGRLREGEPDAAVWDALATDTLAGVTIPPLGTPEPATDVAAATRPGRRGPWDVRVWYAGLDARATNRVLTTELEAGAASAWLVLGPWLAPGDLAAALDGVRLDATPVVLEAPQDPVGAAGAYVALLGERGVAPAEGTNLGADPFGMTARRALGLETATEGDSSGGLVEVAELARQVGALAVVVDATAVHDAGGAEHLELGYALAAGTAYLRALTDAGWSVRDALATMEFRFAATDDQLLTIAKLRAARRQWARVAEICEDGAEAGADAGAEAGAEVRQRQHAVTSRPMTTRYDPWVNMLRATVAAFAAGVGGAEAVTVLPFDAALGQPDDFGRRIARNVSSILVWEGHVDAVADPAGGSYAVERLTNDLARAGWEVFSEIEEQGGLGAALDSGWLAGHVGDCRGARRTRVNHRRQPVTGVTEFPNPGERLPERAPYPSGLPAVAGWAADFEALRDEPPPERVFLATMGPLAAHTARATWATNLLAAGGIAADPAGPTSGVADVLAAYAGQPVACLAGPEAAYAEWGAPLVQALRDAGAARVVVAGSGSARERVGADDCCAVGHDAMAFLLRTREVLR